MLGDVVEGFHVIVRNFRVSKIILYYKKFLMVFSRLQNVTDVKGVEEDFDTHTIAYYKTMEEAIRELDKAFGWVE